MVREALGLRVHMLGRLECSLKPSFDPLSGNVDILRVALNSE